MTNNKINKSNQITQNLMYFGDYQTITVHQNWEPFFSLLANITFKITKKKQQPFSISLVTKREIKKINKEWRNQNKVTDVISFSFLENQQDKYLIGDIYICVAFAKKNAKKNQHSLFYEVCLLFIHGLLHILGYNHNNKKEQEVMFTLQEKILKLGSINKDGKNK